MNDKRPPANWRLLPITSDSGARNMALDHALLEAAAEHKFVPSLRFFHFEPPALTVGRFQSLDDIDLDACREEGIEVVRRPTGGKSILHLADFTYSLVLPAGFGLPQTVVETYVLLSRGIVIGLEYLGLDAHIECSARGRYRQAGGACFASSTDADLQYNGRKICGSAQLRRQGAVLQHGSILLEDRSELMFRLLHFQDEELRRQALRQYRQNYIPLSDTGRVYTWDQIAYSLQKGFGEGFGANLKGGALTKLEEARWRILSLAYTSPDWLRSSSLPGVSARQEPRPPRVLF